MPVTMRGATVRGFTTLGGSIPAMLFANNEQGAWYDPSDFSTLFQNAAGSTPVTAVEQPVRLMLDRSRGLVLGPELVTNGGFDSGATGWSVGSSTAVTGGAAVSTATPSGSTVLQQDALQPGVNKWVRVSLTVSAWTGGDLQIFINNNNFTVVGSNGILVVYIFSTMASGSGFLIRAQGAAFSGTIDNISVRELPGNHATAPNDASRPVLRARYNLLTNTDGLGTSWSDVSAGTTTRTANYAVAPDGTTTASRFQGNNANTWWGHDWSDFTTANQTYTFSIWARALTGSPQIRLIMFFNGGVSYVQSPVTLTGNWVRYTHTVTFASGDTQALSAAINHGSGNDILLWGAQLLNAADQTATGGAYQRVAAATDYDTSNPVFRPYLAFDGTDDSFGTSAIDFSATDEMTVFAGVTKLSDAAAAMLVELSANAVSNAGAFNIQAPVTGGNPEYRYLGGGSTFRSVLDSAAAAPRTDVLTATQDISGDAMELRRNGVSVGTSVLDQGTGNFGNYALFIGRRNNASLPLNGRLYSLAVLGRTATAAELSAMEAWVAGKTGVTL